MTALQESDLSLLEKKLCEYHIRLIGYAKLAHKELKVNIARLFEALSFSKQVQAICILNYMGCIRSTKENLSALIGDIEICSFDKPVENTNAREVIERFDEIEVKNKHLYAFAKDVTESDRDINIGDINVCSKCGYVLVGDTPKECMICHSPSGYFRLF